MLYAVCEVVPRPRLARVACDGEGCYDDSICNACALTENPTSGYICRWCDGWPPEREQ